MLMLVCCISTYTRNVVADTIIGVIQDAKFKRREALADLAKTASKK